MRSLMLAVRAAQAASMLSNRSRQQPANIMYTPLQKLGRYALRKGSFRVITSVAEPHHFYAAPAPGKNFNAASAAPAPALTLLYSKAKFLK
jgi:hypothetical protein